MSVVRLVFQDACKNMTSVIKLTASGAEPTRTATKVNGVRHATTNRMRRRARGGSVPWRTSQSETAPPVRAPRSAPRNGIQAIIPVFVREKPCDVWRSAGSRDQMNKGKGSLRKQVK